MLDREQMVRKAVEACEDDPFIDDVRYQGTTQQGARFEHYVNVVITALEAAGMVVVPREPTDDMICAGIIERHDQPCPEAWKLATANIYTAMLSASPGRGE